jgi:hypothetical protein
MYYLISGNVGLDKVIAQNDGYTINLKWFMPYSKDGYAVAQHIYYSTSKTMLRH